VKDGIDPEEDESTVASSRRRHPRHHRHEEHIRDPGTQQLDGSVEADQVLERRLVLEEDAVEIAPGVDEALLGAQGIGQDGPEVELGEDQPGQRRDREPQRQPPRKPPSPDQQRRAHEGRHEGRVVARDEGDAEDDAASRLPVVDVEVEGQQHEEREEVDLHAEVEVAEVEVAEHQERREKARPEETHPPRQQEDDEALGDEADDARQVLQGGRVRGRERHPERADEGVERRRHAEHALPGIEDEAVALGQVARVAQDDEGVLEAQPEGHVAAEEEGEDRGVGEIERRGVARRRVRPPSRSLLGRPAGRQCPPRPTCRRLHVAQSHRGASGIPPTSHPAPSSGRSATISRMRAVRQKIRRIDCSSAMRFWRRPASSSITSTSAKKRSRAGTRSSMRRRQVT